MTITLDNRQPGDAEAAAAIAALHEHTPSPSAFAIGDWVNGTTKGKQWSGRIVAIRGDLVEVEADMAWLTVDAADITH